MLGPFGYPLLRSPLAFTDTARKYVGRLESHVRPYLHDAMRTVVTAVAMAPYTTYQVAPS